MSKTLLVIGFIFCLLSCKKKHGDLEQSYATQEITRRELHNYTYDKDGKILINEQVTYYSLGDKVTDTTKAISEYAYENRKLVKIITDKDIPELTFTKIFKYNDMDSLTLESWIEHNGDTIHIFKAEYDKQGHKSRVWTRHLFGNATLDDFTKSSKIVYDTSFTWQEYEFESNKHVKTRFKNKTGEIESETQFFYENGKKIRGETYNFIGTLKYLQSTQTFDYSKYSNGEYEAIDKDGVPVETFSVELRNGKLYKSTWTFGTLLLIQFYNGSGKKIKELDFSLQRVMDYKYDNKGNEIEIFEFPMPDSEFNSEYKAMKKILESKQN